MPFNSKSCILSKFYIKPQPVESAKIAFVVVSYRNSTSNHNRVPNHLYLQELYLIEILHQTTTRKTDRTIPLRCILSKFYIKPQPLDASVRWPNSCILSKFYIKPQLLPGRDDVHFVVSYRNSTSNHNYSVQTHGCVGVVSYRNSTSNHNNGCVFSCDGLLYLIEILHQTTTVTATAPDVRRCILSKFYIKPQPRSDSQR